MRESHPAGGDGGAMSLRTMGTDGAGAVVGDGVAVWQAVANRSPATTDI
jgi:hypothetical protein